MPKRPPKKWFKDCTKGVEKSGYATDPVSVCGDLWFNKMSEEDRQRAVKKHEALKRRRKRRR